LIDEENSKWKCEAYFVVQNGAVQAVEAAVKTSASTIPFIKRVGLKIGRKLESGEVSIIQSDYDDYDPNSYKLPKIIAVGPVNVIKEVPVNKQSGENKSTGDSALQLIQKGVVEVDQSWRRENSWWNQFMSNFSFLNNSNEKLAIRKVTSEYKDKDGKWTPFPSTILGYRQGYYNYNWNSDETFTMGEMDQFDMAIRSSIEITDHQIDRLRRAHKSLPQPLEIKIIFDDSKGKKSTIITTFVNDPLELVTKESRRERSVSSVPGKAHDCWVQCDDINFETRLYSETFWNKENARLEICSNDTNKNKYLYLDDLKKIAYGAVQQKQSEVEITDLCWEREEIGLSIRVFVLVDLEKQRSYALKYVLKTTTSSCIDYYLIPKFPPPY